MLTSSSLTTLSVNKGISPIKKAKELLVQQQDGILVIKINRPQSNNALNRKAMYELILAVQGASNNSLIKVVVITGVGEFYSSGMDLKQIRDYKQPQDYYRGANQVLKTLIITLINCPKLLVCLVNGPCIGIGFTMTALCDAVYCRKNAYFHTPFSQLGLCPEACASSTFPRQFGKSWSTNLLIFGEKLSAEKAEQLGFVLKVLDDDLEVEEIFWPKMRQYAKLSSDSLRAAKRLISASYKENLMRALNEELKEFDKLRRGPIFTESMEKFQRKSLMGNKSKL